MNDRERMINTRAAIATVATLIIFALTIMMGIFEQLITYLFITFIGIILIFLIYSVWRDVFPEDTLSLKSNKEDVK